MSEALATEKKTSVWGGGKSPFNVSWGKMYMWFFLVSDAFTFSSLITAYGVMRHRFFDQWPVPSEIFTHFPFTHAHLPMAYVGLMTFILIMSSVTMVLAVDAGHRRDNKGVAVWLGLTVIGGFMFLGSQAWEWYNFITGSEHGAYVLEDGRVLKPNHLKEGTYVFNRMPHDKFLTEAEAAPLIKTAQHVHGANLHVNEYGHSLFADFFFFITGFHGFHVFSGVMINLIIWFNVLDGIYFKRGHYEQVEKAGLYWHFVDLVWVFVFTFFYLV